MTTKAAEALYRAQHVFENEERRGVTHNPHGKPETELPAIYCYSNVRGGGDGIAYAMAQDGTVLGSHWCSHEVYVPCDLGVLEGRREDRHEDYRKHYPDGYRMVFIAAALVSTHPGLSRAYELNQEAGAKAKASEAAS